MATAAFTLSTAGIINWQGKTGNKAIIQVISDGTTLVLSIFDAYYPGGTALPTAGDKTTITIVAGRQILTISIKPRTVPPIVWGVYEVLADGSKQLLMKVNDPLPAGDPYSTAITIVGL